ncbi:MAG: hypothetical protein SFW62_03795 [Alphaproteobacteria bacterium]|nr:hypothetical protein [Alphaproteobacteria bacterium]
MPESSFKRVDIEGLFMHVPKVQDRWLPEFLYGQAILPRPTGKDFWTGFKGVRKALHILRAGTKPELYDKAAELCGRAVTHWHNEFKIVLETKPKGAKPEAFFEAQCSYDAKIRDMRHNSLIHAWGFVLAVMSEKGIEVTPCVRGNFCNSFPDIMEKSREAACDFLNDPRRPKAETVHARQSLNLRPRA